jgi:hypothetical protein
VLLEITETQRNFVEIEGSLKSQMTRRQEDIKDTAWLLLIILLIIALQIEKSIR